MPNIPKLETVKVLPCISAGEIFLFLALPAKSFTEAPICVKLSPSVCFTTGTTNPSSTATATPTLMWL